MKNPDCVIGACALLSHAPTYPPATEPMTHLPYAAGTGSKNPVGPLRALTAARLQSVALSWLTALGLIVRKKLFPTIGVSIPSCASLGNIGSACDPFCDGRH